MADEHKCLHEVDLAVLSLNQEAATKDINEIKNDIKKLLECMQGNGKKGILTRLALLEQIRAMSPKKTLGLSGVSGLTGGGIVWGIVELVKHFTGG
jgi:hypothetical protein